MPFGKLRQELEKARKAGGAAPGSPVFERLLSHMKKYPEFWKGPTGYFRLKWYGVKNKDIPRGITDRLGWRKGQAEMYEKMSRVRVRQGSKVSKMKRAFDEMAAGAEEIAKQELQNRGLLGLPPEERKKRVLSAVVGQLGKNKQYTGLIKYGAGGGIRKHLEEKKIL